MMIGAGTGLILGISLQHVKLTSRELMYVGYLAELLLQILKAIAVPLTGVCIILAFSSMGKELTGRIRSGLLAYVIVTKSKQPRLECSLQ
jgi:L-cystine uptake protein TcyP (sodium:dicarboxylate symporter family)